MKYRLSGMLSIWQHCDDKPDPVAGKPSICKEAGACAGHWIEKQHMEIVEASSKEEAIDLSMSVYEGRDLEPTWDKGYPKIEKVKGGNH